MLATPLETFEFADQTTRIRRTFRVRDIPVSKKKTYSSAEKASSNTLNGAHVAGPFDVQGVAPKFLLVRDRHGLWHIEGSLPDHEVQDHWIVKFPRERTEVDRLILRNEGAYMAVASWAGLDANPGVFWEGDCLFIPRFDRSVNARNQVVRHGLESLYSLSGVSEFGVATSQDELCKSLCRFATNPVAAAEEFVRRDVLNVMLGNKDNHGRNNAVLRREDGFVGLSPLFDFAPMYLDPEGIARQCRWRAPAEVGGQPDWGMVVDGMDWLSSEDRQHIRTHCQTGRKSSRGSQRQ